MYFLCNKIDFLKMLFLAYIFELILKFLSDLRIKKKIHGGSVNRLQQ